MTDGPDHRRESRTEPDWSSAHRALSGTAGSSGSFHRGRRGDTGLPRTGSTGVSFFIRCMSAIRRVKSRPSVHCRSDTEVTGLRPFSAQCGRSCCRCTPAPRGRPSTNSSELSPVHRPTCDNSSRRRRRRAGESLISRVDVLPWCAASFSSEHCRAVDSWLPRLEPEPTTRLNQPRCRCFRDCDPPAHAPDR